METNIAIILLVIMVLMDTHIIKKLFNSIRPVKSNITSSLNMLTKELFDISSSNFSQQAVIQKLNNPTVWIYNNDTISSRHWASFYSRRYKQPTSAIINLCLRTIIYHTNSAYNIQIFSDDDIPALIPEQLCNIKSCKSEYMKGNLIKYSILHKYGGLWVPNDTIMLQPVSYTQHLDSTYITTFSRNNNNYGDSGISDNIIATKKSNPLIKTLLNYIIRNTLTFQNSIEFKHSINKKFNIALINYTNHEHYDASVLEKCSGEHFNIEDLFTTNLVKFRNIEQKQFISLHIDEIEQLREFNYALRLSKSQIFKSNLFLSELFNRSLQ